MSGIDRLPGAASDTIDDMGRLPGAPSDSVSDVGRLPGAPSDTIGGDDSSGTELRFDLVPADGGEGVSLAIPGGVDDWVWAGWVGIRRGQGWGRFGGGHFPPVKVDT